MNPVCVASTRHGALERLEDRIGAHYALTALLVLMFVASFSVSAVGGS